MSVCVAVIIATSMRRTDLLIERSLPSVYAQVNASPWRIYVVDDNACEEEYLAIRRRVKQLRETFFAQKFPDGVPDHWFKTEVIRNTRTQGRSGSGAWNSGAHAAWKHRPADAPLYFAILDDDDEWYPQYLARCCRRVAATNAGVAAVVSAFHRHESGVDSVVRISAKNLTLEKFFIGNPGWQGSNTFVHAETFWRAGGYDESMPSTQDRDFAIRVLEVSRSRGQDILVNDEALLRHHAHQNERVTLCREGKRRGLDLFYEKYAPRMNAKTRQASLERAERLFGYRRQSFPAARQEVECYQSYEDEPPIRLVIGVTSSCARNVKNQIASLARQIRREPKFAGMCRYVVLTNGRCEEEVKTCLQEFAPQGFTARVVGLAEQRASFSRFPYRDVFELGSVSRKSIAFSRTLLHFFCWEEAKKQGADCRVLILDDDLQFESLAIESGALKRKNLNFLGKIGRLSRNSAADIIVSPYSDAPALPFYSSLRTQLLDIYHTLYHFARQSPENTFSFDLCTLKEISGKGDYYYDLSSARYDHLERAAAWQLVGPSKGQCVSDCFRAFLRDIQYLSQQANITRPLLASPHAWNATEGGNSVRRGGIALYLNLSLLVDVPNLSPLIERGGFLTHARRSDFIAAIHMVKNKSVKMEEVSLPLRHHRRVQNSPCEISPEKLAEDIVGLCFYRVFAEYCDGRFSTGSGLRKRFAGLVNEYLDRIAINHLRADQLVQQISELLAGDHWWRSQGSGIHAVDLEATEAAIDSLRDTHLNNNVIRQMHGVKQIIERFDVVAEVDRLLRFFTRDRPCRVSEVHDFGEFLPASVCTS
ncbi:glycosyltransferase family 2 protein [Microbulbifer hydrolyticus]|uniref:Glycosyltransferase n=1 Tax=Microbulbifer hydrolyticus TaxID=48074 RepID=A0A6P1TFT6_9GAMM|nr:glycosyltransferase [Microbulbifer hydrolyticus]MBB5211891.1 glycosyltransferase involved in cell wall biosynthesis [Microbulbifer hydrolyticus]QHQ40523.1 glycosyltransferase [Microbulbifer hydrolyticus]